jgi:hypothetical protein
MTVLNESLFIMHLAFIAAALFVSFSLPFPVIVALVIAHTIHTIVFKGCPLTRLQHYFGGIPPSQNFFQYVVIRLCGCKISKDESKVIYGVIIAAALLLSIV